MKKRRYKAIIFDLDGTLIDSMPCHFTAFKEILEEMGIKADGKYIKHLMGLSTGLILKNLKKKYKLKQKIEDLREERRYHYFKIINHQDITFPGVNKKLRQLKKHHKLAIATGSSKITFTHSTSKKFQELFDVIVTINDVKKGKPNPEQLILAAKKLKLKTKDCLMVGDSLYDAVASKKAKMDFVAVTTGFTSKKTLLNEGAIKVIPSVSRLRI